MSKDFSNNVLKLFNEVVTDNDKNSNASDLLNILKCKVTVPLKYLWEDSHLKLVYYNVSLNVESDLSSIEVSYTSDYVMVLEKLQGYDAFQLAEFVLSLERDIPKWKHIWVTDDKLRKEKGKISERIKATLKNIRQAWISNQTKISSAQEQQYRIRFYNIKATELMLNNNNPFWINKKSEEDILDEFNTYHLNAPIEEWFEEWIKFTNSCDAEKSELERKRQEYHDKLMKMHHLINIKELKIKALLKTIELHHSVSLNVEKTFDLRKLGAINYGYYNITLKIDNACTTFRIKYDLLDVCIKKVVEYFKRINDIAPELRCTLIEEGMQYYVSSNRNYFFETQDMDPFYIAKYSNKRRHEKICTNLSSSIVINRINHICNELSNYISSRETDAA